MHFGQLVIGPPGSGKTTYCHAMSQFLKCLGRKVAIINIDPANDVPPFKPDVDIFDLIKVEDVMENLRLGPNGGLIYCMEYLEENCDWLLEEVKKYEGYYLLIDCPGQVELYTHHRSLHNVVTELQKAADIRLVALHLVDSHYCSDPGKFVSVLLTSLSTMLQMELPHINVLSKCDIIEKQEKLHFNMDFYTDVLDLSHLTDLLSVDDNFMCSTGRVKIGLEIFSHPVYFDTDDPFLHKYKKLNESLVSVVENYSLVSFLTLSVKSKESMTHVLQAADKASGYVFGSKEEDRNIQAMLSYAMGADFEYSKTADIREKYMNTDESGSFYSAR